MLQVSPAERPTAAEILRHPLFYNFVPPPRCSTPVMRRNNSLMGYNISIRNGLLSRSGVSSEPVASPEGTAFSPVSSGSRRYVTHRSSFTDPTQQPLTGSGVSSISSNLSSNSSFTYGDQDESRKTTPFTMEKSLRCSCAADVDKLQGIVKEQKLAMEQMTIRMQSYDEQLKAKDIEIQTLRNSVEVLKLKDAEVQSLRISLQQLQAFCEKMQKVLGGSKSGQS